MLDDRDDLRGPGECARPECRACSPIVLVSRVRGGYEARLFGSTARAVKVPRPEDAAAAVREPFARVVWECCDAGLGEQVFATDGSVTACEEHDPEGFAQFQREREAEAIDAAVASW